MNENIELMMPIKAAPYDHQKKAFAFACDKFGVFDERLKSRGTALLMEMGTGKTIVSIAVAGCMYQYGKVNRVLVVAPLFILGVWEEEFEKFADFPYSLTILKGTSAKKKEQLTRLPDEGLQVVVVNYESAWRLEKELLAYNADGGYATSLTYVQNLCSIIERWNLTQFDVKESETAIAWYRVRKTWADSKTQKGAYKILENAKKCADANPGYSVFDVNGVNIYTPKTTTPVTPDVPFLVRITITDLNIRKGPGTDYDRTQFIPVGVYTIVEVKSGKGSTAGWGRLKSGAGWISLDFATRI